MSRLVPVFVALLIAAPAEAGRKVRIDISDLSDRMVVAHDGEGHYIAVWTGPKKQKRRVFYGNGKRFFEADTHAHRKRRDGRFAVQLADPRVKDADVIIGDRGLEATCQRTADKNSRTATRLSYLDGAARARLLRRARFYEPPFDREPHALARDAMGTYYYVDHRMRRDGERERRDYRLYIGAPGKMRRARLRSIASDSVGQVFATRKGALQLRWVRKGTRSRPEVFAWVSPNKKDRIELTNVPALINQDVIFNLLLVYGSVRYGTHCDDL